VVASGENLFMVERIRRWRAINEPTMDMRPSTVAKVGDCSRRLQFGFCGRLALRCARFHYG